jgi:hypothetical protein
MRQSAPPPMRLLAVCAATALLLAGCAADTTNYPSLTRRAAERISGTSEVVPATPALQPPAPPSADRVARLAQLGEQAEAAHSEFMGRRDEAAQLVAAARGASVGSENWARASVALAGLETARSQAMIALADLDALYAAERTEGGNAAPIAATRDRVIGLIAEEDQVLAQLSGRIAS